MKIVKKIEAIEAATSRRTATRRRCIRVFASWRDRDVAADGSRFRALVNTRSRWSLELFEQASVLTGRGNRTKRAVARTRRRAFATEGYRSRLVGRDVNFKTNKRGAASTASDQRERKYNPER